MNPAAAYARAVELGTGDPIVDVRRGLRLGVAESEAVVSFLAPHNQAGFPLRQRALDGRAVFHLNLGCGTCPALFERHGEPAVAEVERLNRRLTATLERIDDEIVTAYAGLIVESRFSAVLLDVLPKLVHPGDADEYYAHEQLATWGPDPVTGVAVGPKTAYYRTFDAALDARTHVYEFVVPLAVTLDEATVQVYADAPEAGTAVALTIIDAVMPATRSGDGMERVVVVHFLLDGHHKVAAAARQGRPVRLLALVDEGNGLAGDRGTATWLSVRRGTRSGF